MLLSIVINVWPGSDLFRFQLQLHSLLYHTNDCNNYYKLIRDSLNGWNRNKFTCKNYHKLFESYNFKYKCFDRDNVEIILASDSNERIPLMDIFDRFASKYLKHKQIVYGKYGLSTLRNLAMQIFKGKYIVFRDDDDLSIDIYSMLLQCKELNRLNVGNNDLSYQNNIPPYDNVIDLYSYFKQHQKYPTIAISKDSIKLKNTWSSRYNPFAISPTPLNTKHMKIDYKASNLSMCGRIFSREAIHLIYNTSICNGMEDGRSNFLQQRIQHCIYLFRRDKLRRLRRSWNRYKSHDIDDEVKHDIHYINREIISYEKMRISSPNDIDKINVIDDMFRDFHISKVSPFFIYVLPSGSYSSNSWAWGTVIGVLEAFRCSGKHLKFTMSDLAHLKILIEHGIKTSFVDSRAKIRIKWIGDADGVKVSEYLDYLSRHKYIYWFATVENKYEWKILEYKMRELRKHIRNMPKYLNPNPKADKVISNLLHPNQLIKTNVNGKIAYLPNCNQQVTDKILYKNVNYTDTPELNIWIYIIAISVLLILISLIF